MKFRMTGEVKKAKLSESNEYLQRNLGYPTNNNSNYTEYNPFLKDQHGFSTESVQFNGFISRGMIQYSEEESYEEALKYLKCSDPESFSFVSALYSCRHCSLVFKHPKRFLIHYKWHSFGCNGNKGDLVKFTPKIKEEAYEEEEVKNEGNFECETCNQVFKNRKSLSGHKARVHTSSSSKDCKICNKTFTSVSHLRAHLQTHNEGGSYPCSQCPKKFKFIHSLQRHIPTHLEEKNFQCEHCDKSFGSDLLLKIHSRTHMKESLDKHLKCSFCPKTFHQGFRLVAHERTHTGVKPYQCEQCDQSYPTNSSLTRHRKVSHSSDLPHVCFACGKGYHIRSALEHHIKRSHLKERPHQCTDCDNSYICQSELIKHRNKAHSKASTSASKSPSGSISGKIKKKKIIKKRKKEYSDDST